VKSGAGAGPWLGRAPGMEIQARLHRWGGGRIPAAGLTTCSISWRSRVPFGGVGSGVRGEKQGRQDGRGGRHNSHVHHGGGGRCRGFLDRLQANFSAKGRSFRPCRCRERMIPNAGGKKPPGDAPIADGSSRHP